jgi:hypothetical protein
MIMGNTPNRERIAIAYRLGIKATVEAVKATLDAHLATSRS